MSDQRACHTGSGGDPQSGVLYARHQGAADLRRAGDREADPLFEERRTVDYRNTWTCDGSYAAKNGEDGPASHGRIR